MIIFIKQASSGDPFISESESASTSGMVSESDGEHVAKKEVEIKQSR